MDMAGQKNESLLVEEGAEIFDLQNLPSLTTAAYEPEDGNHKLVTYGVSTEEAYVIPISMYVTYDGKRIGLAFIKELHKSLTWSATDLSRLHH
ncbi:hypothetical protein ACI2OX_10370 [Bacillus sp. N9]